ncbi:adenine phosphoribosyltransferase [Lactarius sanguifluus]|nr:adenine phosphoribosyltransferase [Lactarius sanguifluus]
MSDVEYIKSFLTIYQDFPKKGVTFCDIFPLFRNPLAFEALVTHIVHHLVSDVMPNSPDKKIDVIVALDSRGFLLGPVIALRLGAAFVPVRKRGKLPGECERAAFEKEYGTDEFEMQSGAIVPGQAVVIVDDIIATGALYIDYRDAISGIFDIQPYIGGSAAAAGDLVTKQGGKLLKNIFIAEVTSLKGKDKLNTPTYSIVQVDK